MKNSEVKTIQTIVNEINHLTNEDQATKDMMIVFANGLMAGESLGYARALREVINGTGTDK